MQLMGSLLPLHPHCPWRALHRNCTGTVILSCQQIPVGFTSGSKDTKLCPSPGGSGADQSRDHSPARAHTPTGHAAVWEMPREKPSSFPRHWTEMQGRTCRAPAEGRGRGRSSAAPPRWQQTALRVTAGVPLPNSASGAHSLEAFLWPWEPGL